jgi:hypothetical protein
MTLDRVAMAAANNAAWCDAVCRSHGVPGTFRSGLWLNLRPVPRFYPNGVTLGGPERSEDQLRGIVELLTAGIAGGCAVKDSFGALDLASIGFEVLFEATWIFRLETRSAIDPLPATTGAWRRLAQPAELVAWEKAWRTASGNGEVSASSPLFRAALLADPDIAVLALFRDDAILGGAIANRAAGAIGLSNVFAAECDLEAVWTMAVGRASAAFPGLPIVGYEAADALACPRKLGFEPLTALKVWIGASPDVG